MNAPDLLPDRARNGHGKQVAVPALCVCSPVGRVSPVVADLAHGGGAGQAKLVRPCLDVGPPLIGVVADPGGYRFGEDHCGRCLAAGHTRPGSHVTDQPPPSARALCRVVSLVIACPVIVMIIGVSFLAACSGLFTAWCLQPIDARHRPTWKVDTPLCRVKA